LRLRSFPLPPCKLPSQVREKPRQKMSHFAGCVILIKKHRKYLFFCIFIKISYPKTTALAPIRRNNYRTCRLIVCTSLPIGCEVLQSVWFCVCLSICFCDCLFIFLSSHISKKTQDQISRKFQYMLSVTVAHSYDDNVMRYVLPVLRITSCFHIMDECKRPHVCFVEFARWRHWGLSLPPPAASCLYIDSWEFAMLPADFWITHSCLSAFTSPFGIQLDSKTATAAQTCVVDWPLGAILYEDELAAISECDRAPVLREVLGSDASPVSTTQSTVTLALLVYALQHIRSLLSCWKPYV